MTRNCLGRTESYSASSSDIPAPGIRAQRLAPFVSTDLQVEPSWPGAERLRNLLVAGRSSPEARHPCRAPAQPRARCVAEPPARTSQANSAQLDLSGPAHTADEVERTLVLGAAPVDIVAASEQPEQASEHERAVYQDLARRACDRT